MAKGSRGEDRDGNERTPSPRRRSEKCPHRQLGDIELFVLHHAPEDFFDGHDQVIEFHSLRLDDAVFEWPGPVVVLARQGQMQIFQFPLFFSEVFFSCAFATSFANCCISLMKLFLPFCANRLSRYALPRQMPVTPIATYSATFFRLTPPDTMKRASGNGPCICRMK